MLKFTAIRLIPKGPVRSIPRADTLFGAIGNALSILHGDWAVKKLVDVFMEGARISSAFPYSRNTYYFPKPMSIEPIFDELFQELNEEERYAMAKRIKNAEYLDAKNFELALQLRPFAAPSEVPYVKLDVPKVVLDRVTDDSALYFWEEIRFKKDSGMYFLYSGPKEFFNDYIAPALRFLSDSGIGGKSTWGAGLFKVEFRKISINAPKSEYGVTLSNTLPTRTPILWKVQRKGGWSFGRRKPRMTFITEGSVVKNDPGRIETLDLGIGFPVYVYGLSFQVPAFIPEGLQ